MCFLSFSGGHYLVHCVPQKVSVEAPRSKSNCIPTAPLYDKTAGSVNENQIPAATLLLLSCLIYPWDTTPNTRSRTNIPEFLFVQSLATRRISSLQLIWLSMSCLLSFFLWFSLINTFVFSSLSWSITSTWMEEETMSSSPSQRKQWSLAPNCLQTSAPLW